MNQIGNFDYVPVISDLIIQLIEKDCKGVYNVGTEKKSMFDLAKKTKKDVIPSSTFINDSTPSNVTMNITKMKDKLDK